MHANQLKASSQKWMTAALVAFSQGPKSYDFAVHHAGIAAEHLLKAYLASLHPALIAEARHFDSLLHTTGHGTHSSIPANQVKTIGLVEAHSRVLQILRKQIPINKQALEPIDPGASRSQPPWPMDSANRAAQTEPKTMRNHCSRPGSVGLRKPEARASKNHTAVLRCQRLLAVRGQDAAVSVDPVVAAAAGEVVDDRLELGRADEEAPR
ncbi:hypothetical protein [Streptomyces sp. NPDC002328]|uniref:hypothetical protein n=1 Tax=Streptomyces sp. NPDC002328 TaxID=3364642 RepID=UPI0036C892B0